MRLFATAAVLAAVAVGCSHNTSPSAATAPTTASSEVATAPTATTTTRSPSGCDFKAGDPIPADVLVRRDAQGACVRIFECADGRLHVEARGSEGFAPIDANGGGKGLEGFAPIDHSGKPRTDTHDAVWQVRGPEYNGTGRTKLQFDCGG